MSVRIHIIVSFCNVGGAQIAALRLARGLRDRGHDPKVLFLYEQARIDSPDHPYEVLLQEAVPGAAGYASISLELARILRREKPDIVLTFLPLANVLGQAAALLTGVTRRIVSHRTPVHAATPLLRSLDTLWAGLGVYSEIIAVSESVRMTCSHYPAWLLKRTAVVHNGLRDWAPSQLSREQARDRFNIPHDKYVLVAVGRLNQQKNYPLMLRIARRLDGVLLVIAGEGSLRGAIEAEIAALGIGDKVRLLGSVAHADVADLLATADLFIQTSTYEGQSNAILEALQNCTPIVAHDIPEQRETIAELDGSAAGALVPLGDLDAWVAAIEKLRNDNGLVAAAQEIASRRSQLFKYDTMIAGFERALIGK